MMSDVLGGEGGSKMTPKNRTLEGKNRMLGGEGGSKIVENRRTPVMHVPLYGSVSSVSTFLLLVSVGKYGKI